MKRSFALLMAALLLLPACTKEIRTETLKLEEDIPFHEGSNSYLDLDLDIDFPISGFNKQALENVRRAIRSHCLGDGYADFTGSLQELCQDWRDEVAKEYVSTNEATLEELEMEEGEAPFLNWGFDYKGSFGQRYLNFVNYMIEEYQYLGGAHGTNAEIPLVFDRKTGEIVPHTYFTGHLAPDLLKSLLDEYKLDNLKETIGDFDLNEDEIFYVEEIEPSEYYTVDEKGITFYYQPYDIAPYVFGVITITIPWEEL